MQVAEAEKKARRYTNVSKFSLGCVECGAALVGQAEAQKHATSTGHSQFTEY